MLIILLSAHKGAATQYIMVHPQVVFIVTTHWLATLGANTGVASISFVTRSFSHILQSFRHSQLIKSSKQDDYSPRLFSSTSTRFPMTMWQCRCPRWTVCRLIRPREACSTARQYRQAETGCPMDQNIRAKELFYLQRQWTSVIPPLKLSYRQILWLSFRNCLSVSACP